MQTEYRFQLDKGSTKHHCPSCNKKRFVRFVDTVNNELLPPEYGRCDRSDNCKYFKKPESKPIDSPYLKPKKSVSYTESSYVDKSTALWYHSTFAQCLIERFGKEKAEDVSKAYSLGASTSKWEGANVFWQIDSSGNVHGGKVMNYDTSFRRVKEPNPQITWAHTLLKSKDYIMEQCFFGEHLLKESPSSVVGIVESEKTAMIASIEIPQFVWIATGGKNGCKWTTNSVNQVLNGRKVIMFPDLGAYDEWNKKAPLIAGADVRVSDLLEKYADENDREAGLDLADYLLHIT